MKKKVALQLSVVLMFLTCIFTGCFDAFGGQKVSEILYPLVSKPYMTVGDVMDLDWSYTTTNNPYQMLVSETGMYSLFTVTSSNTSVVEVFDGYRLRAVGAGTAMITISAVNSWGCTVGLEMQVTGTGGAGGTVISGDQPTYSVTGISFDSTNLRVMLNESSYYSYTVTPRYLSNVNRGVTCTSADESIATATYTGSTEICISGKKEGKTKITVKSIDNPSVSKVLDVEVYDSYVPTNTVKKLTMSNTEYTLDIDQTFTLFATADDPSHGEVKWSSSNTSVATVVSGLVTGVGQGEATITATSKDSPTVTATCKITVTANKYVKPTGIKFTTASLKLEKGAESTLEITAEPAGAHPVIVWSSSNSCVSITQSAVETQKCTVKALTVGKGKINVYVESDPNIVASIEFEVTRPATTVANNRFWGTWIRMDKGTEITINDTELQVGSDTKKYYFLEKSNKNCLYLDEPISGTKISMFEYDTPNVIKVKLGDKPDDPVIPFYRKGGTNLNYSLKIVGFVDSASSARSARSAATPKKNIKVKGTSNRFKSFESETTTTDDGEAKLVAPLQGDVQTVIVETGDEKNIVIDNLKVENNGDYMGTVPIVEEGDYSLKITGIVTNKSTTGGYIYAGHTYELELTVTNISEVDSRASIACIEPDNSAYMSLSSSDISEALTACTIDKIKSNVSWKRHLTIQTKDFTGPAYVDTKIKINIQNGKTGKIWEDYIPLRIFRKETAFTFSAEEKVNAKAALNGFLIYPDGNNQFFTVPQGTTKTIKAPLFRDEDRYTLVFSGATVDGDLDSSTELYYTVSLSETAKPLTFMNVKDQAEKLAIMQFGEGGDGNEDELHAYPVNNDFEARIEESDNDFYSIQVLSTGVIPQPITTINTTADINFTGGWFTTESGDKAYKAIVDNASDYKSFVWEMNGRPLTGNSSITIHYSSFEVGENTLTVIAKTTDGRFLSCSKIISYTAASSN